MSCCLVPFVPPSCLSSRKSPRPGSFSDASSPLLLHRGDGGWHLVGRWDGERAHFLVLRHRCRGEVRRLDEDREDFHHPVGVELT